MACRASVDCWSRDPVYEGSLEVRNRREYILVLQFVFCASARYRFGLALRLLQREGKIDRSLLQDARLGLAGIWRCLVFRFSQYCLDFVIGLDFDDELSLTLCFYRFPIAKIWWWGGWLWLGLTFDGRLLYGLSLTTFLLIFHDEVDTQVEMIFHGRFWMSYRDTMFPLIRLIQG